MLKLDIAFSLTVSLLSLFNSFSFFSFVGAKGFFFSGHKGWEEALNAMVHERLRCKPVSETGKRLDLQENGTERVGIGAGVYTLGYRAEVKGNKKGRSQPMAGTFFSLSPCHQPVLWEPLATRTLSGSTSLLPVEPKASQSLHRSYFCP